jgi:usherin
VQFLFYLGPAGITPPKVVIQGPSLMTVSWDPPLQPNGMIEFYTIRLPEPHIEVRNISVRTVTFDDLKPYTEYTVTVTACTSKLLFQNL